MGFKKTILLVSAFALTAFTAPVPDCPDEGAQNHAVGTTAALTAQELITISPATASCAGATSPEECADASQAAPALNKAFETYKITSKGEQAALIAYMLFESVDFKYKKNHFPGRPGQGTRMMAMPPFVKQYATAVAGAAAVTQAEAAGGDAGVNAILALANRDDATSFGSAAWFLSTQCSAGVRAGLDAETLEGWHTFLTECVGTTAAAERDPAWTAATKTLGGY
ncbi:hypothetical protein EJ02DRAFT_420651 [Clathrospora elynae]|uniref:Uncharacterized protein n=1 Tax=Clathrospora elynae TaxID=706981 RepID=A0A6A5SV39_9PLEO|nr:hypothetical protein EJ02DRAFT_420651 [Clathrospora elynae]